VVGETKREYRGKAVVLGGSISGLLAARVLSDFYDSVTVVERDALCDRPLPRRGVPQSRLPHIPAARGIGILEALFPGFLHDLVRGGARVWNDGDLSRLCLSFNGHRLLRSGIIPDPESVVMYHAHRPFLEWSIRRRVDDLANVEMLDGHDAVRLTATHRRDRVTGVVLAQHCSGAEATIMADLVVDATGRGSRAPFFLEELGYPRPREDRLVVHVAYAGLPVHVPAGALRENVAFAAPEPNRPRGFAMFAGENDTYMLAVQTIAGEPPPADRTELLACLADVAPPHVLAAACAAEPLAELARYRFPSNRWRRYDSMPDFPDGMIVIGDAMCNFNPLYGQGMSVAAVEAVVLQTCLREKGRRLPRRFFRGCAAAIRASWQSAVSSDLALPQISGKRPISIRVANAYMERILTAAESDPAVVQQFLRLISMVDPPSTMLQPSKMMRVMKSSRNSQARPCSG
jgi:2-polyprenyl-6-methoxyphenol hydroxylase-like FAD-dependent oxidoreductase